MNKKNIIVLLVSILAALVVCAVLIGAIVGDQNITAGNETTDGTSQESTVDTSEASATSEATNPTETTPTVDNSTDPTEPTEDTHIGIDIVIDPTVPSGETEPSKPNEVDIEIDFNDF